MVNAYTKYQGQYIYTEPILKRLGLLKLTDVFKLNQLKFYHKLINNKVPSYFMSLQINPNENLYNHNTRRQKSLHINRVYHEFAKRCIRNSIPSLVNGTESNIIDKVHTHSLQGFSTYVKKGFICSYTESCQLSNCYVCRNTAQAN